MYLHLFRDNIRPAEFSLRRAVQRSRRAIVYLASVLVDFTSFCVSSPLFILSFFLQSPRQLRLAGFSQF